MMEKLNRAYFFNRLYNKKKHFPFDGQIELTYRCNIHCIHCYCKGSADKERELTTQEWKKILAVLQKEGCLCLCLTGGDPLIRNDFLEIYAYAKAQGFIVTLFTNGQAFTKKIIDDLAKSPPHSIEITLNGITQKTYEAITQVKGSFSKVIENIKKLKEKKLPLVLKSNCLKENKNEIAGIKAFTEELLGRPQKNRHRFKYDPMIRPGMNGDEAPTNHRLSFQELLWVKKQDGDIWQEYLRGLHSDIPALERNQDFLYLCDAWMNQFYINPYGRLKFCNISEKFSVDLKTTPFKEGFYKVFPQLLKEKFKTDSKCKTCRFRPICYYCPARAYLETGNEEGPVSYFCELAKGLARDTGYALHRTLQISANPRVAT